MQGVPELNTSILAEEMIVRLMCTVRYKGAGIRVRRYDRLHHNHAGVVSLSGNGSEVAISLTKSTTLDSDYQVDLCLLNSSKIQC